MIDPTQSFIDNNWLKRYPSTAIRYCRLVVLKADLGRKCRQGERMLICDMIIPVVND
ncbi:hypothetical protein MTR67_036088 [Solanum verrucosum]|uniref:Uncharacterized protein n=1 Tax=Solanum verrucosum TaxID=315347 RepID=A0AAF0UBD2_SOLVR|nr:hypothetical protein MTR67_036088 [Solanum verrucosum]